jgi:hypothetical protein
MLTTENFLVSNNDKKSQLYTKKIEFSELNDFKSYRKISIIAFNGIISPMVSLYDQRFCDIANYMNSQKNRGDMALGMMYINEGSKDYYNLGSHDINSVPSLAMYCNGNDELIVHMCGTPNPEQNENISVQKIWETGLLFDKNKFLLKLKNEMDTILKKNLL